MEIRPLLTALFFSILVPLLHAQPTFKELPGHTNYLTISSLRRELNSPGRVDAVHWSEDGLSVQYLVGKNWKTIDLTTFVNTDTTVPKSFQPDRRQSRSMVEPVGRAQQRAIEKSPDGQWRAIYRDFNVFIESTDSAGEKIQVTFDGTDRVRFGTGCWVYGEELDQKEAMWWSPDSTKLAYYEVDERGMKDYHLSLDNTLAYTKLKSVRYPKPGEANPKVSLWIFDVANKQAQKIAIDGEPTQYLYAVRFSPNGDELLVNRTNRRQDVLDLLAIDVTSLSVRTVLTERQATWQENRPQIQFLSDQQRFVWESEASGWKQFVMRHIDGRLLNPLSEAGEYACGTIEKIDEQAGYAYYTAFSDKNPYNTQLHRVKLDGSQAVRLTTSPLNHTFFSISPDHRYVIATREQVETPPCTVLYDETGRELAVIVQGNRKAADKAGLPVPELFSILADDGKTTLYGTLHKPAHFDPSRRYPLIVDVYGGPASPGLSTRYQPANPSCEFGYLMAKIGNRGTIGRDKAFESATYLKLGGVDMDDQAAAVKYLRLRPYVDGDRVGIYGHSYGGYLSALALLRYPDVFHVAVAGAPVTDFRNYDTIYTERYMRTPAENLAGYDAGSCNAHAANLKGKLLLVHGLIDDNVHPSNTWQLAKALNDANKRFQMMIYPEFDHGVGSTYSALRWEFFHQHLKPDWQQQK